MGRRYIEIFQAKRFDYYNAVGHTHWHNHHHHNHHGHNHHAHGEHDQRHGGRRYVVDGGVGACVVWCMSARAVVDQFIDCASEWMRSTDRKLGQSIDQAKHSIDCLPD
jgi:hypothetical protein